MVGVREADERGPARVLAAALVPVLERHLERDLDRGRARVRVEHAAQARRSEIDQARGQLGAARMCQPEHGRVSDPLELAAHGLVDEGVAMAMDVAPQG